MAWFQVELEPEPTREFGTVANTSPNELLSTIDISAMKITHPAEQQI